MKRRRRLLSIGHSYVVTMNRRLAHEMAKLGGDDWEITAVAPRYFQAPNDLRPVQLDSPGNELAALSKYIVDVLADFKPEEEPSARKPPKS